MPLLLVDLDNTLIDRAGASARWATGFAAAHGRGAKDVEWLVAADGDGFAPREQVAAMIAGRFGLNGQGEGSILAELRAGLVSRLVPDEADIEGARAAGLRSVWLHRGRPWPRPTGEPDQVADSFPHAVELVLGGQRE